MKKTRLIAELTDEQKAARRQYQREWHRKWRAANPDKEREYLTRYRAANSEKRREQWRAGYAANAEKMREKSRARYAANAAKINVRHRKWRVANGEKINAQRREHRAANRVEINARKRGYSYKALYGITTEDYERMLKEQAGKCGNTTCKVHYKDHVRKHRLHVDHDHVTGKVRGLLCSGCNIALGNAGDSAEILRGLAVWVERHSSGQ